MFSTEQKQHFGWFGKAGGSFQGWFGMVGETFEVFDLSRVCSTAAIDQPLLVESRKVKVSCWWFLFWKLEGVGRGWVTLALWLQWFPTARFRSVKERFHFNLLKSLFKFFVCSF